MFIADAWHHNPGHGVDGKERWWLEVCGKGSKVRLIPATGELMTELMRFRKSLGLSALPMRDDAIPLLPQLIGKFESMARSAIHEIVKGVVRDSAHRLRTQGPEFESVAAHLEQASTHWMRHTAGSHMSRKADLMVIRDNLGHANLSTTSIYLHTQDEVRHDATVAAHHIRWKSL